MRRISFSNIVGKIRKIRLYFSRTKGRFNPIKVGKFPTILLNKVEHLDPRFSDFFSFSLSFWIQVAGIFYAT